MSQTTTVKYYLTFKIIIYISNIQTCTPSHFQVKQRRTKVYIVLVDPESTIIETNDVFDVSETRTQCETRTVGVATTRSNHA